MHYDVTEAELDGIPVELLDQLSFNSPSRKMRRAILVMMSDTPVSVDDVLIRLYRSTGIALTRHAALGHLFRLRQKKLIQSVDGRYTRLSDTSAQS